MTNYGSHFASRILKTSIQKRQVTGFKIAAVVIKSISVTILTTKILLVMSLINGLHSVKIIFVDKSYLLQIRNSIKQIG